MQPGSALTILQIRVRVVVSSVAIKRHHFRRATLMLTPPKNRDIIPTHTKHKKTQKIRNKNLTHTQFISYYSIDKIK